MLSGTANATSTTTATSTTGTSTTTKATSKVQHQQTSQQHPSSSSSSTTPLNQLLSKQFENRTNTPVIGSALHSHPSSRTDGNAISKVGGSNNVSSTNVNNNKNNIVGHSPFVNGLNGVVPQQIGGTSTSNNNATNGVVQPPGTTTPASQHPQAPPAGPAQPPPQQLLAAAPPPPSHYFFQQMQHHHQQLLHQQNANRGPILQPPQLFPHHHPAFNGIMHAMQPHHILPFHPGPPNAMAIGHSAAAAAAPPPPQFPPQTHAPSQQGPQVMQQQQQRPDVGMVPPHHHPLQQQHHQQGALTRSKTTVTTTAGGTTAVAGNNNKNDSTSSSKPTATTTTPTIQTQVSNQLPQQPTAPAPTAVPISVTTSLHPDPPTTRRGLVVPPSIPGAAVVANLPTNGMIKSPSQSKADEKKNNNNNNSKSLVNGVVVSKPKSCESGRSEPTPASNQRQQPKGKLAIVPMNKLSKRPGILAGIPFHSPNMMGKSNNNNNTTRSKVVGGGIKTHLSRYPQHKQKQDSSSSSSSSSFLSQHTVPFSSASSSTPPPPCNITTSSPPTTPSPSSSDEDTPSTSSLSRHTQNVRVTSPNTTKRRRESTYSAASIATVAAHASRCNNNSSCSIVSCSSDGSRSSVKSSTSSSSSSSSSSRVGTSYKYQKVVGGKSSPINNGTKSSSTSPQDYLNKLLHSRHYSTQSYCSLETGYYNKPTLLQKASYGLAITRAVRSSDTNALSLMLRCGLSSNPCNKYGESVIHMVCRRNDVALLKVLLEYDCSVQVSDDFGRTPLHDACWTSKPNFECIDEILKRDVRLLYVVDCRGSPPLSYVKRENWGEWINFFERKKEEYWPMRDVSKEGEECPPKLSNVAPHTNPVQDVKRRGIKKVPSLKIVEYIASGKVKAEDFLKDEEEEEDVVVV